VKEGMKLKALAILFMLLLMPYALAQGALEITISTDSDSYNAGETVTFSGRVTLAGNPIEGAIVVFEVRNPQNTVIASGYATTSSDGGYSKQFTLPSDAQSGTYKIYVSVNYQGQAASTETAFSLPRSGAVTTTLTATTTTVAQTTTPTTTITATPTCLIATAAYGSELTPEVQFLRSFRDGKVMRTFAGSQFMVVFNAWYYSFSPYIARFIANNQPLRTAVKAGLYPLIGILRLSAQIYDPLSFNPEAAVIMAGLVASFLIGLIYLSPITTLITWSIAKRKLMPKLKQLNLAFITIWLLSLSLILLGELVASSQMLMLATSMFVTSTLFSSTLITINLIYKK
jgi:peptide/nickel transport system substrate-binding protein